MYLPESQVGRQADNKATMSSRSEKERAKAQQEKLQAILSSLLQDEDNKYCEDCDAKGLTLFFVPLLFK